MNAEERERILGKVRKMMERAKDPNAPDGEVEASLSFVRKFMDQFNISEAEVLQTEAGAHNAYESMVNEPAMERAYGRFADPDMYLAIAVKYVCDVDYIKRIVHKDTKMREQMVFYGLPRDVAVAKELFQLLIASMTGMAKFKFGKESWSGKHHAYCVGFADRVWHRAYDMKQAGQRASAGTAEATAGAIVLIKENLLERYKYDKLGFVRPKVLTPEEQAAAEERRRKFDEDVKAGRIKIRKARPRKDYRTTTGYASGWSDGGNVSLGTNGVSGKEQGKLNG